MDETGRIGKGARMAIPRSVITWTASEGDGRREGGGSEADR